MLAASVPKTPVEVEEVIAASDCTVPEHPRFPAPEIWANMLAGISSKSRYFMSVSFYLRQPITEAARPEAKVQVGLRAPVEDGTS